MPLPYQCFGLFVCSRNLYMTLNTEQFHLLCRLLLAYDHVRKAIVYHPGLPYTAKEKQVESLLAEDKIDKTSNQKLH